MTIIVWIGTLLLSTALIFQVLAFALSLEREPRPGWQFISWAMFILALRRATALYCWTSLAHVNLAGILDAVVFPLAVSLTLYYGTLRFVTLPKGEILSDKERSVEYRRLQSLVRSARRTIEKSA